MAKDKAKKKKKTFTRKGEKRYTMVNFTTPIYEEEFTFPSAKNMPQKLAVALDAGRFGEFYEWLRSAGVAEEEIEAFADLDGEETRAFIDAWGSGQVATLPKS